MRRTLAWIALGLVVALSGCSFFDGIGSNSAPVAVADADPVRGHAPLRVQLDASRSSDDGTIMEYIWQCGAASIDKPETGIHTEHLFEQSGSYTIRLCVTDETGLTAKAEIIVTVENTPPLASCRFSSDSPVVGEWILFDASASFDPDGELIDFIWDFGDGESARGTRVGHAYETPDVYPVRLTIQDNAGATTSIVHSFTVHLGGSGGGCGGGNVCL